jgi:Uma2 family endonuclease
MSKRLLCSGLICLLIFFNGESLAGSFLHSLVQVNIVHELEKLDKYNVFSELTIDLDGVTFITDIALYPKRKIDFSKENFIKMRESPILAVEILSPSQSLIELEYKIAVYIGDGVKSCWLIIPFPSSVIVFDSKMKKTVFYSNQENLIDPTLDITIPMKSIFN